MEEVMLGPGVEKEELGAARVPTAYPVSLRFPRRRTGVHIPHIHGTPGGAGFQMRLPPSPCKLLSWVLSRPK